MAKSKRPPADYDLAGLAGRVIDARKSAGLTQAELAAAVGTSQRQICKIETGFTGSPRIDSLAKIAAALGIRVRDLIDPSENGKPSPNKIVTTSKGPKYAK